MGFKSVDSLCIPTYIGPKVNRFRGAESQSMQTCFRTKSEFSNLSDLAAQHAKMSPCACHKWAVCEHTQTATCERMRTCKLDCVGASAANGAALVMAGHWAALVPEGCLGVGWC